MTTLSFLEKFWSNQTEFCLSFSCCQQDSQELCSHCCLAKSVRSQLFKEVTTIEEDRKSLIKSEELSQCWSCLQETEFWYSIMRRYKELTTTAMKDWKITE